MRPRRLFWDKNKDAVLLEQEHSELTIYRIEGALHIPMGEVQSAMKPYQGTHH